MIAPARKKSGNHANGRGKPRPYTNPDSLVGVGLARPAANITRTTYATKQLSPRSKAVNLDSLDIDAMQRLIRQRAVREPPLPNTLRLLL